MDDSEARLGTQLQAHAELPTQRVLPVDELYLQLMKGCLTRSLFLDEQHREPRLNRWQTHAWNALARLQRGREWRIVERAPVTAHARAERVEGRDMPPEAETMVGHARLDNLQQCIASVIEDSVPGDLIETGVWRGGASIFMRAVLAAHGVRDRNVWLADSFQGFPQTDPDKYPADGAYDASEYGVLEVSLEQVKANFAKYGLLDEQVRFLVGWFKDTLPTAPIEQLAVVRLDGDLYESTIDAISALYPKLSIGGYMIVDDYNAPLFAKACGEAIRDYRAEHSITEPMHEIDWTGVYWRRER
jgi:O-methyltransferase